jgi:hypothetical protein
MSYKNYTATVRDIAGHFDYTEAHTRRLAREGKIPSVKRGRAFMFDLNEVEAAIVVPQNDELEGL